MKKSRSFIYFLWRLLLFISLALCCLVLIANNSVIQKYAILETVRGAQIGIWDKCNSIKSYFSLRAINEELSKSNYLLLEQCERYKEKLNSLSGERLLYDIDSNLSANNRYSYVWANVVKNVVNTSHNYFILNKGSNDGITPDMGVITSKGAAGVVRGVGKNHSYVISMLNSTQQLSVKVGEVSSLGILKWDGTNSNGAILREIPRHIKISIGDTVRTSGYSSLYPSNIDVGVITTSKVVKGTSLELGVELFQDFRELEYVVIVKNNSKQEVDSLSTIL